MLQAESLMPDAWVQWEEKAHEDVQPVGFEESSENKEDRDGSRLA